MALTGTLPARRIRVGAILGHAAHRTTAALKTTTARLSGSLLTMAGLGCIDVGAFTANTIAGWITTGVTVLLLDWTLE